MGIFKMYTRYCLCNWLGNFRYQINARTELAIRYNDISPLENHHCAVAFKILSNPECNIFANVDKDTFKRIRAVSIFLCPIKECTLNSKQNH